MDMKWQGNLQEEEEEGMRQISGGGEAAGYDMGPNT